MLELLSPAGSAAAVRAAVQAGADAVYCGFGDFNARRNAKNLTEEEYAEAVRYCHTYGVKVYLTLNTLLNDRELPAAASLAARAAALGTDAVLVQDLGVARMLRQTLPGLPMHASTQMTVHSLDGVKQCADMGFTRVVLARELTRDQIAALCRQSPIELEVFVHGAMCMCWSGQCWFSSVIGGRSGNRGLCAQPCRLAYGWGKKADGHPLSLKDLCLVSYLKELRRMGVSCIKIEGRMKRPEYVGIVTDIYAKVLKENRDPTPEELRTLEQAFSRQGFTDGYYTGRKGAAMFGVHEDGPEPEQLYADARARFVEGDLRKVPVKMYALVRRGEPARLAAEDPEGRVATADGPVPEEARSAALTRERTEAQIARTGGTPYRCASAAAVVGPGLSLPVSALNAMRRQALSALTELRTAVPPVHAAPFRPGALYEKPTAPPALTVRLRTVAQLSDALLDEKPALLWLPAEELLAHKQDLPALLERVRAGAVLPRIATDDEMPELRKALRELKACGIEDALVGNLGLIAAVKDAGLAVHGDYGIPLFNSLAAKEFRTLGFRSAAVSFELRFAQIRALNKAVPMTAVVYGRLPLMITENDIRAVAGLPGGTEPAYLTDRTGARFPVLDAPGGRSEIFNSKVLYWADKPEEYRNLGLHAVRLDFTCEPASECARIAARYRGGGRGAPADRTRGLYKRGVE